MKKVLILLLCVTTLAAAAQKNSKPPVVYKKAISISPFALADMDHNLLLTGEYRLKPKVALLADVGYIFASEYMSSIKGTWGFNFRPAVRLYYGKRNKGYLQAQAFYKMANYTLNDWVGKNCVEGVPAYEEQKEFDYRKEVAGFNIIAGVVLPLSPSHKWLVDLYGGLGFRYKKHHLVNSEPNSCYNLSNGGLFDFQQDDVAMPNLPLGVRLTYVLQ